MVVRGRDALVLAVRALGLGGIPDSRTSRASEHRTRAHREHEHRVPARLAPPAVHGAALCTGRRAVSAC